MKITRERKWLCGILGLGVGALVLDQTLLGTPESASAQEGAELIDPAEADTAAPPEAEEPVAEQTPEGAVDLSDFAARLEAASSLMPSESAARDAFALPGDWQVRLPEVSPDNEEQAKQEVDAFLANHALLGTFDSGSGVFAIVEYALEEGKPPVPVNARVGDRVDGFELRQIEDRKTAWVSVTTGGVAILRVVTPETP